MSRTNAVFTAGPANVVFVGDRNCGKSSLITQCASLTNVTGSEFAPRPGDAPRDVPLLVSPIFLQTDGATEGAAPMVLIDTAASNVVGTQDQIKQADMIVVVVGIDTEQHLQELQENWIRDQLQEVKAHQPVCLVLNKIDSVSKETLQTVMEKWNQLIEAQLWEKTFYVSAKTGQGVEDMLGLFSDILIDCRNFPRKVLYDRYADALTPNFVSALTRVFRCLDADSQEVLGFQEMRFLNEGILQIEFTPEGFNHILQKLNLHSEEFVTQQGLTLQGFLYTVHLMVAHRKWEQCWNIVRHYGYEDDLTLKSLWGDLPRMEVDEVIELLPTAYHFLEDLFDMYSISRANGPVLTMPALRKLLSVLPENEASPLLASASFLSLFEIEGDARNPSLTRNGWLSYWALFSVEAPSRTFRHLTYLLTSLPSHLDDWLRVCQGKLGDLEEETMDRTLIRALILADKRAGKTEFCRQLVRRQDMDSDSRREKKAGGYKMFCNRIDSAVDEYKFLCLTEVVSNNKSIRLAIDELLPCYDIVILGHDLSSPRSFKVMQELFALVEQNNPCNLPVQILAFKADKVSLSRRDRDGREISAKLDQMGLSPQEEVWVSTGGPQKDFPSLFRGLVDLAQNPALGRIRPKPKLSKWRYVKRTLTLSMLALLVYGVYLKFWVGDEPTGDKAKKDAKPPEPKPAPPTNPLASFWSRATGQSDK